MKSTPYLVKHTASMSKKPAHTEMYRYHGNEIYQNNTLHLIVWQQTETLRMRYYNINLFAVNLSRQITEFFTLWLTYNSDALVAHGSKDYNRQWNKFLGGHAFCYQMRFWQECRLVYTWTKKSWFHPLSEEPANSWKHGTEKLTF